MSSYRSVKFLYKYTLASLAIPILLSAGNTAIGAQAMAARTALGEPVELGKGTVRSYVNLGADNAILEMGVLISDQAMAGLPEHMTALSVSLPEGIPASGFKHLTVDWNPHGHEPPGVYDLPHFDVHFYQIGEAERMQIAAGPEPTVLAPQNLPPGHITDGMSMPEMGVHWVDPTSPEFQGSAFDKTFIYGSYKGKMIFLEPMVTRTFLEGVKDSGPVVLEVKRPAEYGTPGWYPSSYSMRYDAGKSAYVVAITGLKRSDK